MPGWAFYGPVPGAAAAASRNPLSALADLLGITDRSVIRITDQNLNFIESETGEFVYDGPEVSVVKPPFRKFKLAFAEDPDDYKAAELNNPSIKNNFADALEETKISPAVKIRASIATVQSKSAAPLRFPANLGNGTAGNIFPFIQFAANVKKEGKYAVFLPIPSGLTFSDNMQYSSLDLGIMGNIVSKAVGAAVNQSNLFSGIGAGIGAGVGTIVNQIKSTNAAAALSIATKFVGSDNLSNAIDFGARQVIAPNTNTAFQNSGVRQFQFSFKMMPTDQKEANTISQIVRLFRENMYPAANDLILTYPPVWNIDFFNGHNSKPNTKLPGIHACYLIAMSAVYNSSGNMFHADGHPVETDIQLTFEETRALTLADIKFLSEGRNA